MKALLVLLSILTFNSLQTLAQNCSIPGEVDGIVIEVTTVNDYNQCLNTCQLNTRCECFTYYGSNKNCLEYSDCESLNLTCTSCLSGVPGCDALLSCNQQGFCNGHIDGLPIPVADENECLNTCKVDANCKWYVYNSESGDCTLLRDCTFLDSTCTTCSSGQKECPLIG